MIKLQTAPNWHFLVGCFTPEGDQSAFLEAAGSFELNVTICSSSLEYLFVAGEHCDHETRLWAQEHFGVSGELGNDLFVWLSLCPDSGAISSTKPLKIMGI